MIYLDSESKSRADAEAGILPVPTLASHTPLSIDKEAYLHAPISAETVRLITQCSCVSIATSDQPERVTTDMSSGRNGKPVR